MGEFQCESIVATGKNKGKQCSRKKTNGCFCKQHFKTHFANTNQQYIEEPILPLYQYIQPLATSNYQYTEPSAPSLSELVKKGISISKTCRITDNEQNIPVAKVVLSKRDRIKRFFKKIF